MSIQTLVAPVQFTRYGGAQNTINIRGFNSEDIVIASTLRVTNTVNKSGYIPDGITANNIVATLQIKDRSDGEFKNVYMNDNDLYITPSGSEIGRKLVRNDEIDNIIDNPTNPRFSNVFVEAEGYINWYTDEADLDNVNTFIGIRNNNGIIQFRNTGGNWLNIGTGGAGSGSFIDLTDTVIDLDNLESKPYLKWNSETTRIVNVALDISEDTTPQLGAELDTNSFNISFNNGTGIVDSTSNTVLAINNANTHPNYLEASTYLTDGGEYMPIIKAANTDGIGAVSMRLSSQDNGDLVIDVGSGDVNITAANISLNSLNAMNFNSGYVKSSITTYHNIDLSTNSEMPQAIDPSTDIMILQVSGNDGRFYAKIDAGVANGQNLNIVYETNGSNNRVEVMFYDSRNENVDKQIGVGSGLASKLIYTEPGQGSSMVYLEFDGYTDNTAIMRNRWQIMNTGADVVE